VTGARSVAALLAPNMPRPARDGCRSASTHVASATRASVVQASRGAAQQRRRQRWRPFLQLCALREARACACVARCGAARVAPPHAPRTWTCCPAAPASAPSLAKEGEGKICAARAHVAHSPRHRPFCMHRSARCLLLCCAVFHNRLHNRCVCMVSVCVRAARPRLRARPGGIAAGTPRVVAWCRRPRS
jgi:hypothetical protein